MWSVAAAGSSAMPEEWSASPRCSRSRAVSHRNCFSSKIIRAAARDSDRQDHGSRIGNNRPPPRQRPAPTVLSCPPPPAPRPGGPGGPGRPHEQCAPEPKNAPPDGCAAGHRYEEDQIGGETNPRSPVSLLPLPDNKNADTFDRGLSPATYRRYVAQKHTICPASRLPGRPQK